MGWAGMGWAGMGSAGTGPKLSRERDALGTNATSGDPNSSPGPNPDPEPDPGPSLEREVVSFSRVVECATGSASRQRSDLPLTNNG